MLSRLISLKHRKKDKLSRKPASTSVDFPRRGTGAEEKNQRQEKEAQKEEEQK